MTDTRTGKLGSGVTCSDETAPSTQNLRGPYSGRSWLALAGGSLGEQAPAVSTRRRKLWSLGFANIIGICSWTMQRLCRPSEPDRREKLCQFLTAVRPWSLAGIACVQQYLLTQTSSTPNMSGIPGFRHVSMETFKPIHVLHDQKETLTITSSKGPIF